LTGDATSDTALSKPGHLATDLAAGALAVLTSRPTARTTHSLFEFLIRAANSPLPGDFLFGVLDPTDEFITSERCDVAPCRQCDGPFDQRGAKIARKRVNHSFRDSG